ncbi:MAG TPA: nucleoside triphosphate pyrophosphatase [Magnetospirillaceae bacterium]|jgi:septum formation protein
MTTLRTKAEKDRIEPRLVARTAPTVILASTSTTRMKLLADAGVTAQSIAPEVDERPVKTRLTSNRARAEKVATELAELKALAVSKLHPDALVIGADQVLDCDGKLLDKPGGIDVAKRQLKDLRGKRHRLISAVAIAQKGEITWSHAESATLSMRVFSDTFLDAYLALAGEAVLGSVGAYQLEALGAQLFTKVEGDFFTVLGLPLLPLLDQLRRAGAIPS